MPEQRITHGIQATNLADILERVLDKGIVIAGDIRIQLADVELLNIKIRLLISSVDKAKELGITWWEADPYLSPKAASKALHGDGVQHPGRRLKSSRVRTRESEAI